MNPIVFWGATGQARVLRELTCSLGFRLVALFDNQPGVRSPFDDVPIYYGEEGFLEWRRGVGAAAVSALVAVGGSRGRERVGLQEMLRRHGVSIATVVHRTAFVAADAVLGEGSQVLAQAAVCVAARLGRGCIVNTRASVDHECLLGDGVHVGPGATLSGCVEVGNNAFIGSGAVVLPRITIGSDSVVGAGAVVTRPVPSGVMTVGNPARVVKRNKDG